MATTNPSAQEKLISSIAVDDIPAKLRCAICSKLAVNAFKLPCCDQPICENCQSTLTSSCPVCEHSPLSPDDCKPFKSLRTTVKVFLRTEEKKRERSKESKESAPPTPVEAKPPVQAAVATEETAPVAPTTTPARDESQPRAESTPVAPADTADQTQQDGPQETKTDTIDAIVINDATDAADGEALADVQQLAEQQTKSDGDAVNEEGNGEQGSNMSGNFGYGPMNGGFSNMGFNGTPDFNQMQMMMAMNNGIGPNAFGSFPMMGMPGMAMDPMTMQNMYMNGGFGSQGMDMNGMSMGMGGFEGRSGSGSNDNWNNQHSWNFGQDNFNHANAPGMGPGDYGNYNSGFQAGYNQGNYGQFNDFRRGNFGGRGRGRGRGGFYGNQGRSGFQQGYGQNSNYMNGNGYMQNQLGPSEDASAANPDAQQPADDVDEYGRQRRPVSKVGGGTAEDAKDEAMQGINGPGDNEAAGSESKGISGSNNAEDGADGAQVASGGIISVAIHDRPQGSGFVGGANNAAAPAPDVPLNAPTGPKAMRQGLPNTSFHRLRARGLIVDEAKPSRSATNTHGPGIQSPVTDNVTSRSISPGRSARPKEDSFSRDASRNCDGQREERTNHGEERERGRSKSRSRSRSRSHSSRSLSRSGDGGGRGSSRRRHRRQRSHSASGDEREEEHRRKKHKSSRKESYAEDNEGNHRSSRREDRERSRSKSVEEDPKKSSRHRSGRHDRDRERDRERHRGEDERRRSHRDRDRDRDDRDRDRESGRDRDRGERERDKDKKERRDKERTRDRDRDRDRDRERDRDRDRNRDRDRDRDRDRERDRDSRHHRRRESTKHLTGPSNPVGKEFNPPTGPRAGNKAPLGPGGSRRGSQVSAMGGAAAAKDPHTLEREARDRERLLKDAQRLAGMAGGGTGKRARERDDDGRRDRRKGRRSEVATGGGDDEEAEERMRRLEAEREAGRW